ncbi:MAG: hypothetical protein DRI84_00875 [Bacteroidetes bacterium]|nr:MAG: hypothetical protein DRI84_00875 [Bacteroidota bacterium]
MKTIYTSLIILTFSISLFAQNEASLRIEDFNRLEISQPLNIYLHQSDSSYILLQGKDVDASKIEVDIQDEKLFLNVKGSANMNSQIHIYTKDFREIEVSTASNIHTEGQLKGEQLKIKVSGASNVKLNIDYTALNVFITGASDLWVFGRADTLNLVCSGASDFDSYGTKNIFSRVEVSGASDVNVNPDSTLIAELTGASELRFKKEPKQKFIKATGSSEYSRSSNTRDIVEYNGMNVIEHGDTTFIDLGNGRTEIIIIDGDDGVSINRKRSNRIRFRGNWAGIELGVNGYLTPSGSINMPKGYEFLNLKYEKSTNFNLNFFQQSLNLANNHFGLVTGLGLRWNNYRFDNNIVLGSDSAVIYGFHDTDPTKMYSKSKLTAWYLTLPLIFEYQTNSNHNSKSFHIGVGVIGGVRLGSHTKQVYSLVSGGGEFKPKNYDSFHLQPFIIDATLRIGWGPINLYGTYSIINMFVKDQGPELRPFMIGIILPFT